jgi:Reverse transcriptase (RNA-dependent DNA polymerase)
LKRSSRAATADRPEPYDSGRRFEPDFSDFAAFAAGMPRLLPHQREEMELPINAPELEAAGGKAPSLHGLPYEFYKTVIGLIGPSLADALNTMHENGLLTESLRRGAVRLIPKVPGLPTAAQLRPITLLSCDYKLLTKGYVARLVPILPTVLTTSHLCSVQGRSIFDSCTAMLSAVEACHRDKRPGYIFNMDFFHAYDRVCLVYVDKVMNFGPEFRSAVATLHREATACFRLQQPSADIPVKFSIRQGDPLSLPLIVIQQEPF